MVWHPVQPLLISVTQCGDIQVWNENIHEFGRNWSTFDANFEVLSENVWFREKDRIQYLKMNKSKTHNKSSSHSSSSSDSDNSDSSTKSKTQNEGDLEEESDMKQWRDSMTNKVNCNQEEEGDIDIFTEDGNLEDFFSGDEDENDLLDPQRDSLHNELIHLPIRIKCDYAPNDIAKYLENIKSLTTQFEVKYEEFRKMERLEENERSQHNERSERTQKSQKKEDEMMERKSERKVNEKKMEKVDRSEKQEKVHQKVHRKTIKEKHRKRDRPRDQERDRDRDRESHSKHRGESKIKISNKNEKVW